MTASTDTGHDAARYPLASFAYDNRDGEIDYAYRAVHLTAVEVKALIADYYGRPADHDYWLGCSTGGRQGLMSAQRFPDDFDGIVAGAPVLDFTNTQIGGVWFSRAMREHPPHAREDRAGRRGRLRGVRRARRARGRPDRRSAAVRFDPGRTTPAARAPTASTVSPRGRPTPWPKSTAASSAGASRTSPASPWGPSSETRSARPRRARAAGAAGSWTPAGGTPLLERFGGDLHALHGVPPGRPRLVARRVRLRRGPPPHGRHSRHPRRHRPQPHAVPRRRRPDDHVSRLVGHRAQSPDGGELLRGRVGRDADAADFYRLFMVPGMFHCGGGRGRQHHRRAAGSGGVGGDRRSPRPPDRPPRRPRRRGADDPAGLPVSRGRPLHRGKAT